MADVVYHPVFEVPTGRLVGADAAPVESTPVDAERAATVAGVVHRVLCDLSQGPAATAAWWVRVRFGVAPLVDRILAHELALATRTAPVACRRLRVGVREADLSLALAGGGVRHLLHGGVALDVDEVVGSRLTLADLRSLQVATVRIRVDRRPADDPAHLERVRTVAALAEAIGARVVAEGVDTDEHLELVRRAGIGLAQGYCWGSPGPLEKLLVTWARPA